MSENEFSIGKCDSVVEDAYRALRRLRDYVDEIRVRAIEQSERVEYLEAKKARLRDALRVAEHGLTTSHGLMAYDDGTPAGAKEHFRLDNTEELNAIKAALAVNL